MNTLSTPIALLNKEEKRSAIRLLPLVILRSFADMLGVALIFPFLKIVSDPGMITENRYLSQMYTLGGFQSSDSFITAIGVCFILVLVLAAVFKIWSLYAVNRWLEHRVHSLSFRLLSVYLRQPYEFMLNRHSTELLTNMLAETTKVVNEVYNSLAEVAMASASIFFMLALLLVLDPVMTLTAIGIFTALYGILFGFVRRLSSRIGATMLTENRARFRVALEGLAGGKQVRLLNREKSLLDSYVPHSLKFVRAKTASRIVQQVPRFVIELVAFVGMVLFLLVLLSRSGGVGSEALLAALPIIGVFALAIYRLMPAFQKGYVALVALRLSSAAAEAIYNDLTDASELPELPKGSVEPLRFYKEIEFRNVSYTYPGTSTPSLKNINLTIPFEASVGIVGQTGAGKTTLMDLILGLIEPTEGEILIDGRKLDHDQVRAWRANAGYVPQDIFLSDASIAQNIAFGVPEKEIDHVRVRNAARMAQIEQFILEELPDGFATLIGERGVRLSGGQRQRISIARALYTEPEVIAFDEATSALDNDTESLVMDEIARLAGSRTLIMVAHRLTTVRDCDMIVTLEGGRIKSVGSYADLVRADEALLSLVSQRH